MFVIESILFILCVASILAGLGLLFMAVTGMISNDRKGKEK